MKKTIKKNTKEVKPAFIVDLTHIEEPEDVYMAFGLAKQNAGLPINDIEFTAIIDHMLKFMIKSIGTSFTASCKEVEITGDDKLVFDSKGNFTVKKPNIFKRFWNWVKKPFKK